MISFIKQNANIKVHFVKNYFYVGEFIKGNIEIYLNSTAIISGILIEIYLSENWKVKDGSSDQGSKTMTNGKTVLTYNLDLKRMNKFKMVDNDILLPSGINLIPFNFRFSEELNPSFEYPLPNKRAYLRYNFNVKVNSPYIIGNSSYIICFISRPVIESEKLLTKSINQHVRKWKIFDKGDTVLKISIPENNYKYDSNCIVTIHIDNTKGKASTKVYKMMLMRKIKYKDKSGETKYKDETDIVSERVRAVVAPGNKETFEYNLNFKEKNTEKKYNYINEINPYYTEMDKIDYFMPSIHGTIIECNYEIKISLYFDCFVAYNDRPRIIMPIYIVHQLPLDYQLEIQEQIDYENALMKSMTNINNSNNIKNNNNQSKNNQQKNYEDKIENNSLEKKYIENIEEEEEDNSLPSLEAIQNAKKNKSYQNIIEENNNNNLSYNIDMADNCPPSVFESAPIPLPLNDNFKKNENNNNYPIYNGDNYKNIETNNNYPISSENNFKSIENENNNNINQNYLIDDKNITNQINIIKESPEDFSLFNTDNVSISSKKSSKKNNQQNIYMNINEI